MKAYLYSKKIIILFPVWISLFNISDAQVVKGWITNPEGNPANDVSIFIQELKQGTMCNNEGYYELVLPPDQYHIIFFSPEYNQVSQYLTITSNITLNNVVLSPRKFELSENKTQSQGKNIAYEIMRKTISLAPYYLNQMGRYNSSLYLKGNMSIKSLIKSLIKYNKTEVSSYDEVVLNSWAQNKEKSPFKKGDTCFMELLEDIEFTAPDNYVQNIISVKSTFPEHGNDLSPNDFIHSSFYQSTLPGNLISPLSPQAFSQYRFKYLGETEELGHTISKIEIIQKRKNQQLFHGVVYILNDLLCLQAVDLTNENSKGRIRVQQIYMPIGEKIWMPVSQKTEIKIHILGFNADANYSSSIRYSKMRPKISLLDSTSSIINSISKFLETDSLKEDSQTREILERILQKEVFSNRDVIKFSKLIQKELETKYSDTLRKNLEIKDKVIFRVEKDSTKKSYTDWANKRPIPLSDTELHHLSVFESLKKISNSNKYNPSERLGVQSVKRNLFLQNLKCISLGHTWSNKKDFSFINGGIINLKNLSFNTVDGFIYGINYGISKRWKNGNAFDFYQDIRWAFSRKSLMFRTNANYHFGNTRPKILSFVAGVSSRDINSVGGIDPFLNTMTTLFLKKNYLKLYGSRYLSISYGFEVINGVTINLTGSYDYRTVLHNTTNFSLSNSSSEYTDNVPDNTYLGPGSNPINSLRDQLHTEIVTNVTFTPYLKYKIDNFNKIPLGSDWPTLSLTWKHGINEFTESSKKFKHYNMVRFDITKIEDIGALSKFTWRIRTVGFLNNANITYYDFFHFNSQSLALLLEDYQDAFMLPPYYSLSTPEFFAEVHTRYTTPYLFLKYLPGIRNSLINENVRFSYLGSRNHENYTEIGYSLSEILHIGEAGFYIGFEDLKFSIMGANLIFRFK